MAEGEVQSGIQHRVGHKHWKIKAKRKLLCCAAQPTAQWDIAPDEEHDLFWHWPFVREQFKGSFSGWRKNLKRKRDYESEGKKLWKIREAFSICSSPILFHLHSAIVNQSVGFHIDIICFFLIQFHFFYYLPALRQYNLCNIEHEFVAKSSQVWQCPACAIGQTRALLWQINKMSTGVRLQMRQVIVIRNRSALWHCAPSRYPFERKKKRQMGACHKGPMTYLFALDHLILRILWTSQTNSRWTEQQMRCISSR